MCLRSLLAVAVLAVASVFAQAQAVTALTVTTTLTISGTVDVNWCTSAGAGDTTAAQSWVLGTVALGTYESPTNPTAPVARFIENNNSNCAVDIAVVCGNSTSWTVGSAAGANIFKMEAKIAAGGTYQSIHTTVSDLVNNLGVHAVSTVKSGETYLQLTTPTSITLGGGLQQTITVTFTASADNGD